MYSSFFFYSVSEGGFSSFWRVSQKNQVPISRYFARAISNIFSSLFFSLFFSFSCHCSSQAYRRLGHFDGRRPHIVVLRAVPDGNRGQAMCRGPLSNFAWLCKVPRKADCIFHPLSPDLPAPPSRSLGGSVSCQDLSTVFPRPLHLLDVAGL